LRVIASIEIPAVIERILEYLGRQVILAEIDLGRTMMREGAKDSARAAVAEASGGGRTGRYLDYGG